MSRAHRCRCASAAERWAKRVPSRARRWRAAASAPRSPRRSRSALQAQRSGRPCSEQRTSNGRKTRADQTRQRNDTTQKVVEAEQLHSAPIPPGAPTLARRGAGTRPRFSACCACHSGGTRSHGMLSDFSITHSLIGRFQRMNRMYSRYATVRMHGSHLRAHNILCNVI